MTEQNNNLEKSKETREILLQEITQKVQTVIADLQKTWKNLTGVQIRNAYESSIKNLNLFVEELSTLSDEEIQRVSQNLKNEIKNEIDKIAQNQNSLNPLNSAVGNVVNALISERKEKARLAALLLALIRSEFPRNGTNDEAQDFGFPTSSQRIESNGGSSVIEKMKLREDYYLTFKEITAHFYPNKSLSEIPKYTGAEDLNAVRVMPYSLVSIQDNQDRMKVIIADCFVEGNAMFVFDMEELKRNGTFGITAEMEFEDIAKIFNSQLKKELENREGVTRIPHDKGYRGKVIGKITMVLEGRGYDSVNKKETERKSRQEADQELLNFARNWWDQNKKQPKQSLKGGHEDVLARQIKYLAENFAKFQVKPIKYANKLWLIKKLEEMGFMVSTRETKEQLPDEKFLESAKEWMEINNRQPEINPYDSIETRLAQKINDLKNRPDNDPLKMAFEKEGFNMEKTRAVLSEKQWVGVAQAWVNDPENKTENGKIKKPNSHSSLGQKIKAIKKMPLSSPLHQEFVKLGLINE